MTTVCGVGVDLREAPSENLRTLLDQLGRNGETEESIEIRQTILAILSERGESETSPVQETT